MSNPNPSPSTRFKAGNNLNPGGKPKGSRDRISKAFLDAFADDFEKNGKAAIVQMRQEDPASYVKVAVALQPKDVQVTTHVGQSFVKLLEMVSAGRGSELAEVMGALPGQSPEVRH